MCDEHHVVVHALFDVLASHKSLWAVDEPEKHIDQLREATENVLPVHALAKRLAFLVRERR